MAFMKTLKEFQSRLIPEFKRSLEKYVDASFPNDFTGLKEMYKYHLGFGDD